VYLNGREAYRNNLPSRQLRAGTLALKKVTAAAQSAYLPIDLKPDMLVNGSNVLAIEVRQAKPLESGLLFDAELVANSVLQAELPQVAFLAVREGSMFTTAKMATVTLDAIASQSKVQSVTLHVDGQAIGTVSRPPYRFTWRPHEGAQRLRAEVVDVNQQTNVRELTVNGVQNIPPRVSVRIEPAGTQGDALTIVAEPIDDDGEIKQVEFLVSQGDRFDSPIVSVGTVSSPPYRVTIPNPHGEHRLVQVQARDDKGELGVASTHIGMKH